MREHLGILIIGVLGACGKVESAADASTGNIDAPAGDIDAAETDGSAQIDGPPTQIDAPAGPVPVLYWSMDSNVSNSGALTGYAFNTPAGIGYAAGKFGQGAMFASGQYAYVDGMRQTLGSYADVTIGFWMREPGNASVAFMDCNNRSNAPYGGFQFGLNSTAVSLCASTTTNSFLGGSCLGFTAPSANTWHHWILRYDATGTAAGQGGPVEVYVDNILVHTRANDTANNPVFNTTGMPDRLTIGITNAMMDDVRIYNQVFTRQDQCTYVVRGTWNASAGSCTLP